MKKKIINGGLYLVIDPFDGAGKILPKVKQALKGGVDILQVWDNWAPGQNALEFVNETCSIAETYDVPVLVNNNIDLVMNSAAYGIHFDSVPENYDQLKNVLGKYLLVGITCENDLSIVKWASKNEIHYISFCSVFPSSTASSCELVIIDRITDARKIYDGAIFGSGGVTPSNTQEVLKHGADGIAVISGILKSSDPEVAARKYKDEIDKFKK